MTAYGRGYRIDVSNSPTFATFTTLYSTTTGNGAMDRLPGLSGSGRYVRLWGTQRGTGWGYSLWEFQVW